MTIKDQIQDTPLRVRVMRKVVVVIAIVASIGWIDISYRIHEYRHPKKPIPQSALSPQHWRTVARRYATQYNLPITLVWSVMYEESQKYDPYDTSDAGCIGLMQLHPLTFRVFKAHKDAQIMNGSDNIQAGCKYLSHLYTEFSVTKGSWRNVLRYYNGGTAGYSSQEANDYADRVLSRVEYR